ncbi:MAG TPA: tetratricopeptide repeat protein [Bacteroidota bacterium]|nr:tetratricopeptide repeat protein [Bacteroidota bacterium]
MKHNFFAMIMTLTIIGLMTQAFQCGSPEMTGAKVYIQQKNYPAAIDLLVKDVQKNPVDEEAWFLLGELREETGDYEGMNKAFTEALKISNDHAKEIYGIKYNTWGKLTNDGVDFLKKGSADSVMYYDKALTELLKAATAWPETSITYKYIGIAYNSKGDFANAIKMYTKAWELGKDIETYKMAGRLYASRGLDLKSKFETDNAEKLRSLKSLAAVDKGSYKADITRELGAPDPPQAGKLEKKKGHAAKKDDSKKEEWVYSKYNVTFTIENDKVIGKVFSKPYNPNIDSTSYFAAVDEFNKAVEVFEAIKKIDPKDNENLSLLLQAYVGADRIKEATKAFKQAVLNDPGNKLNHFILGVLYRTVAEYDDAIGEYKAALAIDPDYSDALFDLGATIYNCGVDMKKAAEEKGDESTAYKQKFQDALPWLEKVADMKWKNAQASAKSGAAVETELRTSDAVIWNTLGTIYARLGQADKAATALNEADNIRKNGK